MIYSDDIYIKYILTTLFVNSVSISTQMKDCKVVFEDIFFSCVAAKLNMLDLSQDKIHTTDSHDTTANDFLKNLCLKTTIACGSSFDERRTQLYDKLTEKLHMCAANIFGPLQPKKRNLVGKS